MITEDWIPLKFADTICEQPFICCTRIWGDGNDNDNEYDNDDGDDDDDDDDDDDNYMLQAHTRWREQTNYPTYLHLTLIQRPQGNSLPMTFSSGDHDDIALE